MLQRIKRYWRARKRLGQRIAAQAQQQPIVAGVGQRQRALAAQAQQRFAVAQVARAALRQGKARAACQAKVQRQRVRRQGGKRSQIHINIMKKCERDARIKRDRRVVYRRILRALPLRVRSTAGGTAIAAHDPSSFIISDRKPQ